ncbi:MAG: apolipoprotein N-acyltransferase, partial [Bacteroidia bacterium]
MLTACFPPFNLFFLGFMGFVPLLYLERKIRGNQEYSAVFYLYTALSLFLWNACTTFWIWNASPEGAIAAFVINTLMMSLPFLVYHRIQLKENEQGALWAFVFAWIAFEYWHLNWQLAWPWLTLGNIFATVPSTVQWYEYTGVFGGSMWILYLNKKVFEYLKKVKGRSRFLNFSKAFNLLFFGIFAPVLASFFIQFNYDSKNKLLNETELNVMVVQPNIDPYTDKFKGMEPVDQAQKMLRIAEEKMDSTIQLVMFPETALQGNIDEDHFEMNESIQLVKQFIRKHPGISVLSGADT